MKDCFSLSRVLCIFGVIKTNFFSTIPLHIHTHTQSKRECFSTFDWVWWFVGYRIIDQQIGGLRFRTQQTYFSLPFIFSSYLKNENMSCVSVCLHTDVQFVVEWALSSNKNVQRFFLWPFIFITFHSIHKMKHSLFLCQCGGNKLVRIDYNTTFHVPKGAPEGHIIVTTSLSVSSISLVLCFVSLHSQHYNFFLYLC